MYNGNNEACCVIIVAMENQEVWNIMIVCP